MNNRAIEELLEKNGFVNTITSGTSMNPFLVSGRDNVLLKKTKSRLKKWDVALYKRNNGDFVLHRVCKVKKDSYVFWGDNHLKKEEGVTDAQILAVMTGYYKGEKYVDVSKFSYKFITRVYSFYPIKFLCIKIKMLFKRLNRSNKQN